MYTEHLTMLSMFLALYVMKTLNHYYYRLPIGWWRFLLNTLSIRLDVENQETGSISKKEAADCLPQALERRLGLCACYEITEWMCPCNQNNFLRVRTCGVHLSNWGLLVSTSGCCFFSFGSSSIGWRFYWEKSLFKAELSVSALPRDQQE